MTAEERKARFVEEAASFFAEHGFEGSTSQLAKRLGITQPLLYRYFPTKEVLIEHVYEHAFPSAKYYPKWKDLLSDEDIPLRRRLTDFYQEYVEVLLNYKFLRLAIWAGLTRTYYEVRYSDMLQTVFFPQIVLSLRRACRDPDTSRPTADEIEMVQSLHASIYYIAVRRWVTNRLEGDIRELVVQNIDLFLLGARATVRRRRDQKRGKR